MPRGCVRRRRPFRGLLALLGATALFAVATPAGAARPQAKASGAITVSAAASLTGAFTALGERFERAHPKVDVTLNFGSSSALVQQIQAGAPADVYASADLTNMDELVRAGQVTASPAVFARNEMQIAVKPGNPRRVADVADLADVGIVALCGATVPCGTYAAAVLKKANVTIPDSAITRGVDAKATLATVSEGDADAAIVYATDVLAAGKRVEGVAIPADENVAAVYPIAPLAASDNPKAARAFVRYVASPAGQKVLARFGFVAP